MRIVGGKKVIINRAWGHQTGMSLIEVMIALGVMGVVSLGVSDMLVNMHKSVSLSSTKDEILGLGNQIRNAGSLRAALLASKDLTTPYDPTAAVNLENCVNGNSCNISGGPMPLALANPVNPTGPALTSPVQAGTANAQRFTQAGMPCQAPVGTPPTTLAQMCPVIAMTTYQAGCASPSGGICAKAEYIATNYQITIDPLSGLTVAGMTGTSYLNLYNSSGTGTTASTPPDVQPYSLSVNQPAGSVALNQAQLLNYTTGDAEKNAPYNAGGGGGMMF